MAVVDVVVVSYKSGAYLRSCIEPLAGTDLISVIVVDNAGGDGSLDLVKDLAGVRTIESPFNLGFAGGCNLGWRAGRAPAVLFLNPDATTTSESVLTLARALEKRPRAGAVSPRVLEADGTLDYSLRRFPRLRSTYAQALFAHRIFPSARWVDEVERNPSAYASRHCVEWVSGASLMARRQLLADLGGLDETYFHYGEDKDLCRRIWDAGYEIWYEPEATVTHVGGASASRSRLLPLLAANRIRYSTKHRTPAAVFLERGGIALGAVTHMLVGRGGWAARAGYAGALRVALMPLEPAASQMARLS
jgi:N-acetylglucosaminyl-diphospho-decaprenol L-rhamnosyltransferase